MPMSSLHKSFAIQTLGLALLLLVLAGCAEKQHRKTKPVGTHPRIVSLAPSLTEMIFAIGAGDQLVGRTSACDWPAEAKKVPIVGAFGRPSLEVLASLEPDLVVDVDLADDDAGRKITELNIRRENIRCRTPDDVPAALRKLGVLTGHLHEADSLAAVISSGLEAYRHESALKTHKTSVYLEIWDDPLWTGGSRSFTSAMITYAGGKNIGDVAGMEYFEISPEWVITRNPEVIACMYMSKKGDAVESVRSRPGWAEISAVKNGRVYSQFDNNLYLRPGPRVLEGISGLKMLFDKR
jgi:iron complex transport system substrate-binding protein